MRFALGFTLLLLALAPAPAHANWKWSKKQRKQIAALEKQVSAGNGWAHTLEVEHWKVETQISPRFTAELGLFMDLFHGSFHELMAGLKADTIVKQKPTVQVFANKAAYEKAHSRGSRGYYNYAWDADGVWTTFHLYTYAEGKAQHEFARFYHPILLHEGTHVLMRALLGKVDNPKWFDEGVATYFQFYDLGQSVKANRKTRYRRSHYRKLLAQSWRKDGPPALQRLIDLGPAGWNPDNMGPLADLNYAQGESVIDCMLSSKKGAEFFLRVFERVRAGSNPKLTPEEVPAFQKVWHKHLSRVLR